MYIKVFPRGEGGGSGPVEYATREDDPKTGQPREVRPVVVKGNPENTRNLIDSVKRKWKYSSGVCSWAPGEVVTPEQETEFIKQFEAVAFAGLAVDQVDMLWVRHQHAGHHELHFISPRLELSTGKAMNAFAPGWQKHFDPLRDRWNIAEGWARPDDPTRARLIQPGKLAQHSSDKKELVAAVHQYALHEVTEGRVNNRQELIASLTEAGLEVTREGKDYVTISDESGKRHRLRGAIYESTFERERFIREAPGQDGSQSGKDRADHERELESLDRQLAEIREKRAQYNQGRYQKADGGNRADLEPGPEPDREPSRPAPEASAALAAGPVDLGDHLSRELGDGAITDMVDRPGSSRQASRNQSNERDAFQRPDLGPEVGGEHQRPFPDPATRDHLRNRVQDRQPGGRETHQTIGGKLNAKPNIAKPGIEPPPAARKRLRRVFELGMVHDLERGQVLLPGNVPTDLEQFGAEGSYHQLRWPGDRPELSRREKEQYKQQLVKKLIGTEQNPGLWKIKWVDRQGHSITFRDGGRLLISPDRFEAQGMRPGLAATRVVAGAKAAGWEKVRLWGSNRFVKLAALEALKNGIEPSARDRHQKRLVDQVREDFERDRTRTETDRIAKENADRAQRANASAATASAELEAANDRISEAVQRTRRDLKPRLEAAMNNELDQIKRINIADYLVSQGYTPNKAKSSKNALCYDHSNGDRLIVGTDANSGHSVYYSVRDDADNGTIIDLIQKRQGLNLGQVRKELRPWIGRGPLDRPEIQPQPRPEPTTKDRAAQARGLAACERVGNHHEYLERRGISPETLKHFRKRIFTDNRGNAIFPHFDAAGVSGLEIKNTRFTGFSKAGEKGLWLSGPTDSERLVICKSAIDCVSHYQLDHKNPLREKTLYVSTAGRMSPEAKQNLQTLLDKYPDAEIVAGFDADADGDKYTGELQEMASEREITRHRPKFKDWNEELQKHLQRQREIEEEQSHRPRM